MGGSVSCSVIFEHVNPLYPTALPSEPHPPDVLGVSSGQRRDNQETWWLNKEVKRSIQRKRLAKKK